MKHALFFFFFLLSSNTVCQSQTIDLIDLFKIFAINDNDESTVQNYSTGAEINDPIEWLIDGIEWSDEEESYVRNGKVIITINGNTVKVLKKKTEDLKWDIKLTGPRSGVTRVTLSPDLLSEKFGMDFPQLLSQKDINFKFLNKHSESFNEAAELYEITFPGKHKLYLIYDWSCGASLCSAEFKMFYSKEEALLNLEN